MRRPQAWILLRGCMARKETCKLTRFPTVTRTEGTSQGYLLYIPQEYAGVVTYQCSMFLVIASRYPADTLFSSELCFIIILQHAICFVGDGPRAVLGLLLLIFCIGLICLIE